MTYHGKEGRGGELLRVASQRFKEILEKDNFSDRNFKGLYGKDKEVARRTRLLCD